MPLGRRLADSWAQDTPHYDGAQKIHQDQRATRHVLDAAYVKP